MKKKLIYLTLLLGFISCSDEYKFSNPMKIADNIFGITFDKSHDWNMTTNNSIRVISNSDDIVKARLLLVDNNSIRILNETSDKNSVLNYDIPIKYDNLLVDFINKDNKHFYRSFNVEDNEVYFKNSSTRGGEVIIGWEPSYPIPTVEPVINGTIPTYAGGERNWLPGEVFYTYTTETTSNTAYTSDFVSTFRSIIFNYFPNGRNYDNLPKIKKSGYYNESVYPITTGDEPIVVSPVYKNDGGFYEICYSELYYYYFKGDLTKEQIEALPKYRAIDLSVVYGNTDNDIIEKKPSYVLAFFGDGNPSIGTVGSYQFERGYKIGFIYKSNTHIDKKSNKPVEIGDLKQGELYGDGRLNYNINNWGNFKTSGLGPTDPRMAWMSVNEQMFLCVESGTDRDYNDLILEVEGGIEPIIIIPDDPEYNYYTFCFEDQRLGDYDMNDVVLKGTRLDETHVEWTLMATGAWDDLYICNINGNIINDNVEVHDLFKKPRATFVNTVIGDYTDYVKDTVIVNKEYSFLDASTQPYIYDKTKNWYIKIARQGEDPHAIMIPYDFKWPIEKTRINKSYLQFNNWGANKVESTDWYEYPEINLIFK